MMDGRPLCGANPHCDFLALKCVREQVEDTDMLPFLRSKKAMYDYVLNVLDMLMKNPEHIYGHVDWKVDRDGHITRRWE